MYHFKHIHIYKNSYKLFVKLPSSHSEKENVNFFCADNQRWIQGQSGPQDKPEAFLWASDRKSGKNSKFTWNPQKCHDEEL